MAGSAANCKYAAANVETSLVKSQIQQTGASKNGRSLAAEAEQHLVVEHLAVASTSNPTAGGNARTDGVTSQNSPSCFRAVIAAASTNLYRSSHCSTYQNNQFDADDESEQQRDSYNRLLQSYNSCQQTPVPRTKQGKRPQGVLMLVKSPSEHMLSISEE